MAYFQCAVCDYIYKLARDKKIPFENLPADWTCPECGAGKSSFVKIVNGNMEDRNKDKIPHNKEKS